MDRILTKEFWKAALIRALYTVAEVWLALLSTSSLISEVNWTFVLSTGAMSGIISLLRSIVFGVPELNKT